MLGQSKRIIHTRNGAATIISSIVPSMDEDALEVIHHDLDGEFSTSKTMYIYGLTEGDIQSSICKWLKTKGIVHIEFSPCLV